jgi:hypothetical protein
MKVDKSKIRTPDEEYAYLWDKINNLGNYFIWDVHPNVARATEITRKGLFKKLKVLVDSDEFQAYNPWYK